MHTRFVIVSLLIGAALTGYCSAQQKPAPTRSALLPVRRPSTHGTSRSGTALVRVPDQVHVYKVGRLPDGDSMREAGNYYHIEQSAYWNGFARKGLPIATNTVTIATGPSETAAAKAYRVLPNDHDLTELRNEAREDKERAAQELAAAKLTREKLEGLTQGLAHTDEVIKEAQTEISALKVQNEELRRKVAKDGSGTQDTDFSKFQQLSKRSKTEGLQAGPGSDD
jgi:hypothetical protein